jgi:hypothetical protein
MELATSRYIYFHGVGIVDHDAPELPSKVLEEVTEQMFTEPSILETIASVLRALHQYERADGFAPSTAPKAAEAVPKEPAPARSRSRPCPRHRRPVRARRRPSPSQLRQPNLWPPPQRPVRRRTLSERRGHRRPARSSSALMRPSGRMSPRGPSGVRRSRGGGKSHLPRDPRGRGGRGHSFAARRSGR